MTNVAIAGLAVMYIWSTGEHAPAIVYDEVQGRKGLLFQRN